MRTRFRVMVSLACALASVAGGLAYANEVREQADRVRSDAIARFGGEVAQLVVAEQPLEAGDVISERNVRVRDWVADLAPVGAISSLDNAIGREVHVPVAQGAPLTELNFRDETSLSEVPDGHVAVSVPVSDKLGISRGVNRGARVSAYAVENGTPQLIASDVQVLSELGSATGVIASQQITIAVLPDDVSAILAASASGDLRLVIPADDVDVQQDEQETSAPEELALDEEVDGND